MSKIATIKNFSNVESNGAYYLESMVARKIAGKSILTPGFLNNYLLSENTSGYTNIGVVRNGVPFKQVVANNGSILMIDEDGYIHEYNAVTPANKLGQIHDIVGQIVMSDIEITKNENILYSALDTLGFGHSGTATGGSTTTLIDTNTDFSALVAGSGAGINKVYDFDNGEEYTITSLTGANQLNFDAGTAVANGHKYVVFLDTGKTNGGNNWNFFTTTSYPQYTGQEAKASFRRQIVLKDTEYLIGNGNFLASLNVDEATWDDNHKQLPDNTQFQCMGVNQGQILVGATRRGKGVLLLWDGYSDGWLAIEELEQIPSCIKPYSSGWLVLVGASLYYSNGYQIKLITKLPDTDDLDAELVAFYNSMLVVNDRVILAADVEDYFRAKNGLWIYEFGSGWSFIPYNNNSSTPLKVFNTGAVFSIVDYPDNPRTTRKVLSSFGSASKGTNTNCINQLLDRVANKYSAMFYVNLPKRINVSQIGLNVSPQFDASDAYGTVTIDVAIGDGKNQLWRQSFAATGSTTTLLKNTSAGTDYQAGIIGHQIRMLEGDTAGERSYVTAIANPGTATEALTISPALSGAPANGEDFNMVALKHADQKSFSGKTIPDEMFFTVEGFYGDKLFIEVYFNSSSATKIDIHSIDIYGE